QLSSAIQLSSAAALFVRPNPEQKLRLQVSIDGQGSVGPWLVSGGQPGVYYQLYQAGRPLGQAAYFHQSDDTDTGRNKGIGEEPQGLRVELDLAITRDPFNPGTSVATRPPPLPLLALPPVPVGSELSVLARKAMSGVTATLAHTAQLLASPTLRVAPAAPAAGDAVTLVVEAAVAGERYTLWRDGVQLGEPREGTGDDLSLPLGELTETTHLELCLERLDDAHLPVERRLAVTIEVV
ncbi:MAG: hypothetical protein OXU20_06070, partial [Myxococcales bacterium]|nr:hypothetical protein [Myxococcales bacterium]